MENVFIVLAGIQGALAVGLGSFGAHGLRRRASLELLATFDTGVRYQIYHSLALIGLVAVMDRWPGSNLPVISGWLFVTGVWLFSGSLYLLSVTGKRGFSAITPVGGASLLAGWVVLAAAALI